MTDILSLISKIHDKGNRFIIEELKKNGATELAPSHGDILVCLYKNGKMTMKNIADTIHRTKPTVTVLINKLEKLGYIKREIASNDNRYTYIVLTEKGEAFKSKFEKISNDLNKMLFENISEEETEKLSKILKKLI